MQQAVHEHFSDRLMFLIILAVYECQHPSYLPSLTQMW